MTLAEALAWSMVHGFTSPTVILPSVFVGWLSRSWWQALVGAAAVALVILLITILDGLPQGGTMLWWAILPGLVPPCIWGVAAFRVGSWVRTRAARNPADIAARIVRTVTGAIIGAIGLCIVATAVGMAFVEIADVSNFEGAAGYLVFLGFAFPGTVIGFLVGGILGWRRKRSPAPPERVPAA